MRTVLLVGGPRNGETMTVEDAVEIKFPAYDRTAVTFRPGTPFDFQERVMVHRYKREILRTGPVTIEVMAYMGRD